MKQIKTFKREEQRSSVQLETLTLVAYQTLETLVAYQTLKILVAYQTISYYA